jgi:dienelactone hydrolase
MPAPPEPHPIRMPYLRYLLVFAMTFHLPSDLPAEDRTDPRQADLELLLDRLLPSRSPLTGRMNAVDKTWEEWVERTGELPPDFEAMPSRAHLPDPLIKWEDGTATPIQSPEEWEEQRAWIRAQVEHWIFGQMPPAPDNLRVAFTEEKREGGVTIRDVLLEFGPEHRASLHLQLMIPDGEGPFPVFLTNHSRGRSFWVRTAVSRGYIACFYQATDPNYGLPDDSDAYIDIYPEYDFSALARWAWSASRAVDYLVTRPEVLAGQIGIAGHSRNGKQALLAAAFDDRIGAVVASSGLTGEVHPWRLTSDPYVVESIQLLTGAQPHWFHPRLRFFAGREHKLPVDQNQLMAMIAPRGLMMYSAHSESSANAFVIEQGYRNVREVYRFLEAEENIWLHLRDGEHSTEVADVENFVDFFDAVFGRRHFPKSETWIHGYTFDHWQMLSGIQVNVSEFPLQPAREENAETRARRAREGIDWALGTPPAALFPPLATSLKKDTPPSRNPLELVFGRPQPNSFWTEQLARNGMGLSGIQFGPGLNADVFYPVDAEGNLPEGKLPVVIWLHPYAHAVGWSAKRPWSPRQANYVLDQRPDFRSLIRRGFMVVAFDQIGFGSRAHEGRSFYQRYPEWSLMGKMVADTRSLIDAVSALEEADASQIHLLGYALGGKVGLFTTALDERIAGVVALSGIYPLRAGDAGGANEGVLHYSHMHGLLPKLGFFHGEEARIPFDYDDILALAAPARMLIVAPELDRFNPVDEVRLLVEEGRKAYEAHGTPEALDLWTPRDFNRFPRRLQEEVFDYLEGALR